MQRVSENRLLQDFVQMSTGNHQPQALMSEEDFDRWRTLIRQFSGIDIPIVRKAFLTTRLDRRMRQLNLCSYAEYLDGLTNGELSNLEWLQLIDSLTIQETSFFRHSPSFELVAEYAQLRVDQSASDDENCHLNLWSIGCSTGEEAYSLAMTMERVDTQNLEKSGNNFFYGVTGVDISISALNETRQAEYSERRLRNIDEQTKEQFFESTGQAWRLVNGVKQRSRFMQLNLKKLTNQSRQPIDVIFCQNVLIYFQMEDRLKILDAHVKILAEGGLLILGPGEVMSWNHPSLTRINNKNCLAYRKNA